MAKASDVKRRADGKLVYRGKVFDGFGKPRKSSRKDKKMMVLVKKGGQVKLVHFGQVGYGHNYSAEARRNYMARSAGIRDGRGRLTKDNPFSPNYWARRILWAGPGGSKLSPSRARRSKKRR